MAREVWENSKQKLLLPDIREAVSQLVQHGAVDAEIAAHLGVSRATAIKIREAAGLARNVREKTKRVQIRIPESLLADLTREAAEQNCALSDVIRHRCRPAAA